MPRGLSDDPSTDDGAWLDVTIFTRPNGRQSEHTIRNIEAADAEWFRANDVAVSMEDIGGDFAIYADCRCELDDGTPDEVIVIAGGRSCQEAMRDLRAECTKRMAA